MRKYNHVRLWAVFSIAWMLSVPFFVSGHYEPIQEESVFVYNAFNTPHKLVVANEDTRNLLIRCFPGTWYNSFSFGIPGKVEIEYPLQFDAHGHASTWMPGEKTITSVSSSSQKWLEFQNQLITEGMKLREQNIQNILNQYLLWDILRMLGGPLIVLIPWIMFNLSKKLGTKPASTVK